MDLTFASSALLTVLSLSFALNAEPEAEPSRQADGAARAMLVVEQEVRGLPGLEEGQVVRHRLTLDIAEQRAVLEVLPSDPSKSKEAASLSLSDEGANRIILRGDMDPPLIYEIVDREKRYRVRKDDLNRIQLERDAYEEQIRRTASQLTEANRKKLLRDNHIRPDGKRIVEVRYGGDKTLLDYRCREVFVTENGRQIIHAWMTEEIPGGNFYQLYRKLGVFSEQVLEKTAALKGLPLSMKLRIVTAGPDPEIEVLCTKVDRKDIATSIFELPAGYEEFKEPEPITQCPICGREIDTDAPGAVFKPLPVPRRGPKDFPLCSAKCKKTFKTRWQLKRPRGEKPEPPESRPPESRTSPNPGRDPSGPR